MSTLLLLILSVLSKGSRETGLMKMILRSTSSSTDSMKPTNNIFIINKACSQKKQQYQQAKQKLQWRTWQMENNWWDKIAEDLQVAADMKDFGSCHAIQFNSICHARLVLFMGQKPLAQFQSAPLTSMSCSLTRVTS